MGEGASLETLVVSSDHSTVPYCTALQVPGKHFTWWRSERGSSTDNIEVRPNPQWRLDNGFHLITFIWPFWRVFYSTNGTVAGRTVVDLANSTKSGRSRSISRTPTPLAVTVSPCAAIGHLPESSTSAVRRPTRSQRSGYLPALPCCRSGRATNLTIQNLPPNRQHLSTQSKPTVGSNRAIPRRLQGFATILADFSSVMPCRPRRLIDTRNTAISAVAQTQTQVLLDAAGTYRTPHPLALALRAAPPIAIQRGAGIEGFPLSRLTRSRPSFATLLWSRRASPHRP